MCIPDVINCYNYNFPPTGLLDISQLNPEWIALESLLPGSGYLR